ncbi:MAG: LuxR C-terminal-related transcriptional regulator [Candidatus Berkiellales bacterium]
MILLASQNPALAIQWRQALTTHYPIYEVDLHDLRALELCLKKAPFDVLIVDLALLGEAGIHEISTLKAIHPTIHIIVMAQLIDKREEIAAILFGAKAYCSHDLDLTILPKIVKTILMDELWVDRHFVSRLLAEIADITEAKHAQAQQLDKGIAQLTPREIEIARLVATGASNRKIAEQLNISERTVKAHLGVIFRKIGISDRLQLALYMTHHQELSSIWHRSRI